MSILDRLVDLILSTTIGGATLIFLGLSAVCMVVTVKRERAAARDAQALRDLDTGGVR